MNKLFEIPIYALSKEELKNRVKSFKEKFENNHGSLDNKFVRIAYEKEIYPYNVWEYNHIVGYIMIGYTSNEIVFKIFHPTPCRYRYRWKASTKILLNDIHANGLRFFIYDDFDNREIQLKVNDMLDFVIKEYISKRFYVDREVFDNLNKNIDYIKIISNIIKIDDTLI